MRDRARLQADHERIARHVVVELSEELPHGDPQEDRNDRQQQEDEGHGRRDGRGQSEEEAAQCCFGSFGSPNPARFSNRRPRFEVTLRMNARASTRRAVELTTASW